MQFNFWKKSKKSQPEDIRQEIIQELRHQQRDRHRFGLAISTVSALMTIFSVGLLYFNQVSEANFTAGSGILTTLMSTQYSKKVKGELDEIMDSLEE